MALAQPSATLARRGAAMCYEAILLLAISFIVSYGLLAVLDWSHPLAPGQRLALQASLLSAFGVYFVYCWSRSGQTLAMKSWHLKVVDAQGQPPSPRRALVRYLAGWTLFAPALLWLAILPAGTWSTVIIGVTSVVVMSLFGRLDPERRLLHDRIAGTRLVL
ncbi:MAG: RDD family protein, partial [Burkholderiaceae bacterium]